MINTYPTQLCKNDTPLEPKQLTPTYWLTGQVGNKWKSFRKATTTRREATIQDTGGKQVYTVPLTLAQGNHKEGNKRKDRCGSTRKSIGDKWKSFNTGPRTKGWHKSKPAVCHGVEHFHVTDPQRSITFANQIGIPISLYGGCTAQRVRSVRGVRYAGFVVVHGRRIPPYDPAYHRMTPAYTYNLFAGAQHTGSNHGTHPRDKATGPKVQNVILTVKLQFGSLLNFS